MSLSGASKGTLGDAKCVTMRQRNTKLIHTSGATKFHVSRSYLFFFFQMTLNLKKLERLKSYSSARICETGIARLTMFYKIHNNLLLH